MKSNQEVVEIIVGLTEQMATQVIEENGFRARLTERDGNYFIVTRDFRTDRINLKVKDGLVYNASIG